MMCSLFHIGLRAANADTTRNFYTRVLGMVLDPSRPNTPVSGYWLRAAVPGSPPSIHVFTDDDAGLEPWGTTAAGGSGAVDHISLYCKDYRGVRQMLEETGLSWQGGAVPGGKQWVIFVYDPNGVMLELNFDATVEGGTMPPLVEENTYLPGQAYRPFEPAKYGLFAR
jgi:catechol 2,3-dioxygenase-like lactoylglutathione lyase family enzyme